MSEVVKYHNDLNLVAFKEFSKIENDVFFALMWKLKDKQDQEIRLEFTELRELIDLRNMTNKEIVKSITDIGRKIHKSSIELETETETQFFTIFQVLAVAKNPDEFYIRAKMNEPFLYILNNYQKGGFTLFELMEFSSLSSKYTQTLYRLLKQFRNTGYFVIEWDLFLDVMDIPASYAMCDIDKRILNTAVKELSETTLFSDNRVIFSNLRFVKERGRGRGRPVTRIHFYFDKENTRQPAIESKKKAPNKEAFAKQFSGKQVEIDSVIYTIDTIERVGDKINAKGTYYNEKKDEFIGVTMHFQSVEHIENKISEFNFYRIDNLIKRF